MGKRALLTRMAGALVAVALLAVLWASWRLGKADSCAGAAQQCIEGKGAWGVDRPVELGSGEEQTQVPDSLFLGQSDSFVPASNLEGYTYYWNTYKQRYLVAAGAHVTAYHQGQQCGYTVSDSRGWYNICVSLCCQRGLVEVEATYSGMSDYLQTNEACNRILRHDFYMDGTQQVAPLVISGVLEPVS